MSADYPSLVRLSLVSNRPLEIDDASLTDEWKHGVSFDEVDEAVRSQKRFVKKGKAGPMSVFSQSASGRLISSGPGNCVMDMEGREG